MKNSVKEIIKVNYATMLELLFGCVGENYFKGVTTLTEPKLSSVKHYAQFGGKVFKVAKYVFAERDYLTAIENQAEKLGITKEWKPEPHAYATHIKGNILCHNEDINKDIPLTEKRLYAQFFKHLGSTIETYYFDANMQPLEYETIKPFLRVNKPSPKQTEFGIKLDPVQPLTTNIIGLRCNGQSYERES